MFHSFYPNISVHGDQTHDSGLVELLENLLVFANSISDKSPDEIIAELLPGISAMVNIHPLLVHFPIALLSLYVFIDIFGSLFSQQKWRELGSWLLYMGAVTGALTVWAGLDAAHSIDHNDEIHEIMEHHEHLAFAVLGLALFLSIWRIISSQEIKGFANFFHSFLNIVLFSLLFFTADLGGYMVFHHGVAVQSEPHVDSDLLDYLKNQPHEHHHDEPHSHDSHEVPTTQDKQDDHDHSQHNHHSHDDHAH